MEKLDNVSIILHEYNEKDGSLTFHFEYDHEKYGLISTPIRQFFPYQIADNITDAIFHMTRSGYGELLDDINNRERFEEIDLTEMKKLEGQTFTFNHEDIFK